MAESIVIVGAKRTAIGSFLGQFTGVPSPALGATAIKAAIEQSGVAPNMMLIDHNNELTVHDVLASGCWAGFSIYPGTKMDEHRMVRVLQDVGPERIGRASCRERVSSVV